MIVLKLVMWPSGDESKEYTLGRAYIANTGGTHTHGNYKGAVCRKGSTAVPGTGGPDPTRQGIVEGHPRVAQSVWRLVTRMLLVCFPEEKQKRGS